MFAQNGVTVSGLAVDAGTVTFNVSWKNSDMPALWSDMVWVFVDYNKNGVMERLPVTSATATAGTVTKIPGNDKGVWIIGNAKTASSGSFSAKVELFTEIKDVAGACAYASNYPPVGNHTSADKIEFTGTPGYDLVFVGGATTHTESSSYTVPPGYTMQSFTDKTGAPGLIGGIHQPQGSCMYTEPAVVGTFASFDAGAATYVSLRDERDNKVYPVVKIGGRWIMARNLNYQTGMTFNAASGQANGKSFTAAGAGIPAIGSFWCPGGVNGNTATSSTLTSCDVWGALYTWETAMMVDGKWSNDTRDNTAWGSDPPTGTNTGTGNTNNGGRGTGNHGICPAGWHVPTDAEWGNILNAMESGSGTTHNNGTGLRGSVAGASSKSKCMCSAGSCNNDTDVRWTYDATMSVQGTDVYGFRVLPSSARNTNGPNFPNRGSVAYFWSSSAYDASHAWYRHITHDSATVFRGYFYRSDGFPVRCMKD